MAIVGFLVFASAFIASISVLWLTLSPAMPQIVLILKKGEPGRTRSHEIFVVESRVKTRTSSVRAMVRPSLRAAA